ncbi:MAG: SPOR domain-containing protein [Lewinellaceae bacterium]|nr:SPOR domain-containing protein [Lewinellaceae bacterium]MCB9286871.1 SPOR domain-containing protein [Lewinellaceae bacterium]
MKKLTIIFASFFLFFIDSQAQTGGAGKWLSFVIQAEGRAGGNTPWERAQRLEVSKRVGVPTSQSNTAGAIRLDPVDKEVRITFSNFTVDGAWFSPSEIALSYNEDGRAIGPIRAMPGPGGSDYYQITLRFREKTDRTLLSVRMNGRPSGQFIRDTINTLLIWGAGNAEPANVQVSYLDEPNQLTARSPYTNTPATYGAYQGRTGAGTEVYAIQLGAYPVLPDSRQFSAVASFGQVYSRQIGGLQYVRVGPYNDPALAHQYLQQIRSSYPEAYIVLEDGASQPSAAPATTPYQSVSPYGQQPSQYGAFATPRLSETAAVTPKGAASSSYILPAGTTGYAIQLASLAKEENAKSFVSRLRGDGLADVYIWKKGDNNRVVVAPFPDKISANNYLGTLKRQYSQEGILVYIDE